MENFAWFCKNTMFCKRPGARTHRPFLSLEPPPRLAYVRRPLKKPTGPEDENVHGCARAVNSLGPISLMFFTGTAKAVRTAPPTNTPQILQTTDENDDFVDEEARWVGDWCRRKVVLLLEIFYYYKAWKTISVISGNARSTPNNTFSWHFAENIPHKTIRVTNQNFTWSFDLRGA